MVDAYLVYKYVYIYIYIYLCVCAYRDRGRIPFYRHTEYVRVCMYVCMYVCMHVCMYLCMCGAYLYSFIMNYLEGRGPSKSVVSRFMNALGGFLKRLMLLISL